MKQVELLSPAGSYESAIAAIQNGCNAVYLAGKQFGARAFAANFDEEEIKQVVQYAHAYEVKVYVTLNTLIHEEEMKTCLAYVKRLMDIQVDALIVQDLGVLFQIRKQYPMLEIHASTQMHIINEAALQFLMNQGITRAVLAREVSLQEMSQFAKLPIELEVFVHGALCVCYSGQCLMSFMIGGRSGNRGACAQSCRMPYSLFDQKQQKTVSEKAYLLSLKDLYTIEEIPKLIKAGVASFKIEGRMKKSEYVGYMTSLYRKKIDDPMYVLKTEALQVAKTLFHRGYTTGYLYKQSGRALYNPIRPNHIGLEIGEIVSNQKGRIAFKLTQGLHQHDGIRFLNKQEDVGCKVNKLYKEQLLVREAFAHDLVSIEYHAPFLKKGDKVVKTSDHVQEKLIHLTYEKLHRKVPITIIVYACASQPLRLIVDDGIHQCEVVSDAPLEVAQNRATTTEEVKKQINKTSDTIFMFEHIEIVMEEALFIPIKIINTLRREVLAMLYEKRATSHIRKEIPLHINAIQYIQQTFTYEAKVSTQEQLLACLDSDLDIVYVEDRELFNRYKKDRRLKLASKKIEKNSYEEVSMIQEIGGLYSLKQFVCDASLNVYNASTCYYLHTLGASLICLSLELHNHDIETIIHSYQQAYQNAPALQKVVYGRCEVMVSEHCPIHACLVDGQKEHCQICKQGSYCLQDSFQNQYPLQGDKDCIMHLYDYKIYDETDKIEYYRKLGIMSVRYDFTFEKGNEVTQILKRVCK